MSRDDMRGLSAPLSSKLNTGVPHSARVWNYWMGGKSHYPVDRAAGDAFAEAFPDIFPMASQGRAFLVRAVRYLAAEAGVRQFIDVGTGLPADPKPNTHEVAQSVAPSARILYVDNDPLVLVNARGLLRNTTDEGVVAYAEANFQDPDLIISHAQAALNFTEPVAVMFMGVLGHVDTFAEMRSIVNTIMTAVPSGSYLVLWDSPDEDPRQVEAVTKYATTGAVPYRLRALPQLRECFEGLELVEPGFVCITSWRPDAVEVGTSQHLNAYGGVARKP
ncbi:MAG TPA: SAM-dependent methyltransferase [Pseudonocardiaceae bacterium]|jgi:hypothetical protein